MHKAGAKCCLFLDSVWLFRLPAFALIGGICLIYKFITSTQKKILAEKAAAAIKAKLKQN